MLNNLDYRERTLYQAQHMLIISEVLQAKRVLFLDW